MANWSQASILTRPPLRPPASSRDRRPPLRIATGSPRTTAGRLNDGRELGGGGDRDIRDGDSKVESSWSRGGVVTELPPVAAVGLPPAGLRRASGERGLDSGWLVMARGSHGHVGPVPRLSDSAPSTSACNSRTESIRLFSGLLLVPRCSSFYANCILEDGVPDRCG